MEISIEPGQLKLPRHLAIIMDGNGRWAKKRGLPRTAGHKAGAETYRRIATFCKELGIEYLTVYAFSTENWKRSQDEVSAIMSLLKNYLLEAIDTMEENGIRLKILGDLSGLSPELRELIARADEISGRINGIQANLCVNYGGRDEIIKAFSRWQADPDREELSEESLSRPSGEYRISNFLLWQCAYSEFYFTDTLWPDFDEKELVRALEAYSKRDRRFGNAK